MQHDKSAETYINWADALVDQLDTPEFLYVPKRVGSEIIKGLLERIHTQATHKPKSQQLDALEI